MLYYCLKSWKNTESKKIKDEMIKNRWIMLWPNCAVCGGKNSRFIKEQEASELLNSLGKRIPLNQIPLVGPIKF